LGQAEKREGKKGQTQDNKITGHCYPLEVQKREKKKKDFKKYFPAGVGKM